MTQPNPNQGGGTNHRLTTLNLALGAIATIVTIIGSILVIISYSQKSTAQTTASAVQSSASVVETAKSHLEVSNSSLASQVSFLSAQQPVTVPGPTTTVPGTASTVTTTVTTTQIPLSSSTAVAASNKIPLSQLCKDPKVQRATCYDEFSKPVGDKVFISIFQVYGHPAPDQLTLLSFLGTPCKELDITFGLSNASPSTSPDSTGTLTVTQGNSPPVKKTVERGQLATARFVLDGGPFDLNASTSDVSEMVANGYAICT